uniref:thyroid transcription factor 1-associated protein 26 homolog isoform X1 n=1 Tax=Monopterus albus TaxID=43700 RepID=UPI0009B2FED1|nr:thyroid transcription factor 1-associated protein 26 isoform X1 [Monopterus albus]
MAPTDQKIRNKTYNNKNNKSKGNAHGVKKKRKWIPEHKIFEGSVNEGQGFAFKRKQKVKHEYNKLLRKKKNSESKQLYKEEYPEHLRHLYMAEEEKLKHEAWTNRMNRTMQRMKGQKKREVTDDDTAGQQTETADQDANVAGSSGLTDSMHDSTTASEKESLPISNRMRKKMAKKTSYQKTKEEFESVIEKRRKKKEEYLKNKQQREEAIQRYKQKKMETFQMLSKKTKRGQPNLNLQLEYLLQKIQGTEN